MRQLPMRPLLIFTAVLAMALFAYFGLPAGTLPPDAVHIDETFDVTPGDAEQRAREAANLTARFPARAPFVLNILDRKFSTISGVQPTDAGATFRILKENIENMKAKTDLAACFDALTARYEKAKTKTWIIIETDGLSDFDPTTTSTRISADVARLAKNKNVKLILLGLVTDKRPAWKSLPEMCAAMGDRLFWQPESGFDADSVQRFLEK